MLINKQSLLSRLKESTGLQTAYQGISEIFSSLRKTLTTQDTTNIAIGASLFVGALTQLPPDMVGNAFSHIHNTFLDISRSPTGSISNLIHGLIPQISAIAGMAPAISTEVKDATDFPLQKAGETPVSNMQTSLGLISAYWFSEKWASAWSLTGATAGLRVLKSGIQVGIALSGAEFIGNTLPNTVVADHFSPDSLDNLKDLAFLGTAWLGTHLAEQKSMLRLIRGSTRWDSEQFHQATTEGGVLTALSRGTFNTLDGEKLNIPAHIPQIVNDQLAGLKGSTIASATRLLGGIATIGFSAKAVIEHSTQIDFLDQWAQNTLGIAPGEYGTAILAGAAAALYIPAITYGAYRLGRHITQNMKDLSDSCGEMRENLQDGLSNAEKITARSHESIHLEVLKDTYERLDQHWAKGEKLSQVWSLYEEVFRNNGLKGLAYASAFPPLYTSAINVEQFVINGALSAQFLGSAAIMSDMVPYLTDLKAKADQITDLAHVIHEAAHQDTYYSRSGIRDFNYIQQSADDGLRIVNLELMHPGHDQKAFLKIEDVTFLPGSTTRIVGENGCGKTTLMNTIFGRGLQKHGQGTILSPEDQTFFYAPQEPYIPKHATLRELVTNFQAHSDNDDHQILTLLGKVGLIKEQDLLSQSEQIEKLNSDNDGKGWKFSGGEKNKLVLAQILYARPDILLLDEATAAMDPQATQNFHQRIHEELPYTTIIAIDHAQAPPTLQDGSPVYRQTLLIDKNGEGKLVPFNADPAIPPSTHSMEGLIGEAPSAQRKTLH
ncbi:MAG: ATP-binding cassette domain-containing protein [Rhodospirillales bacterium]|nr:ATP-binding cassette domain-containing protein [Rhodospirillales bacterium]